MVRTVRKKPSIRCTPNGNQARASSPSALAGTRSMTPELAPRAVARYPAWSDHARKPPAQTPGRSITPATVSSHLVRRSNSTRPASNTHQKSAASPSRNSTSPLPKRTSSPAATRSPSCSSLSPSNKKTPRRSSMSISPPRLSLAPLSVEATKSPQVSAAVNEPLVTAAWCVASRFRRSPPVADGRQRQQDSPHQEPHVPDAGVPAQRRPVHPARGVNDTGQDEGAGQHVEAAVDDKQPAGYGRCGQQPCARDHPSPGPDQRQREQASGHLRQRRDQG